MTRAGATPNALHTSHWPRGIRTGCPRERRQNSPLSPHTPPGPAAAVAETGEADWPHQPSAAACSRVLELHQDRAHARGVRHLARLLLQVDHSAHRIPRVGLDGRVPLGHVLALRREVLRRTLRALLLELGVKLGDLGLRLCALGFVLLGGLRRLDGQPLLPLLPPLGQRSHREVVGRNAIDGSSLGGRRCAKTLSGGRRAEVWQRVGVAHDSGLAPANATAHAAAHATTHAAHVAAHVAAHATHVHAAHRSRLRCIAKGRQRLRLPKGRQRLRLAEGRQRL
mmetsp:Transcript_13026/g.32525  ORF Transcript_13026/g.32525 Transcript_13026/m.32525 type:complete len:282 (+) Transcript_13026:30-875(+)